MFEVLVSIAIIINAASLFRHRTELIKIKKELSKLKEQIEKQK